MGMEVIFYAICNVSEVRQTALQRRAGNKGGNRMSEVRRVCIGHNRRRQYAHKSKTVNGQAYTQKRLTEQKIQINNLGDGVPLNAVANVLL